VHVPGLSVEFGHFAAEVRAHVRMICPAASDACGEHLTPYLATKPSWGAQDFENMTFASVDILYPTI
jgi:hypothetical protein